MSLDQIHIRNLHLNVIIGVYPRERKNPQAVDVDLILRSDLRDAERSDQLADTVDYAALTDRIRKAAARSKFRLLEALAGRIAALCLRDPRIKAVDVTVTKPGALPGIGVDVTLRRGQ